MKTLELEENHLELDGKTQDDDLLAEGRGCEGLYVFTLQISLFIFGCTVSSLLRAAFL